MEAMAVKEQFEMQYNYIFLKEIRGDNKIELIRTLNECEDLSLFEQDVIQINIDYKWNTYAKQFFVNKFIAYFVFFCFYVYDLETLNTPDENGYRIKDANFYVRKIVCFLIQFDFLIYEIIQFKNVGKEYMYDLWNYFEVLGILIFWAAQITDQINEKVSNLCRMLYCLSMALSLIKILFLIRVFKEFTFLVKLLI